MNGITIHILIFKSITSVATRPPNASDHESPMKILAGLILNRRNASVAHSTVQMRLVAKNHHDTNVMTPSTHNTISIIHPASQSSQSVKLIAFTKPVIRKNEKTGINHPT